MLLMAMCLLIGPAAAQEASTIPAKVYVPYEKLKGVFETEKQGIFLPYKEFQRLWLSGCRLPKALKFLIG